MGLWINGYELRAEFSQQVLANSLLWAAAITLFGSLLPAWWLGRTSPAELLRS
jgi:ABC-type lipoprotein release transport system permease subunit